MPEGYTYHRMAGGKQRVFYPCKKCGSRSEEVVDKGRANKYVDAGLCRPCFEMGVEALLRRKSGIFRDAMWIPFSGAMQREGILDHLKAAVEILIEGPQERIEDIIENRNDSAAGFVKHIWEAIRDNPA